MASHFAFSPAADVARAGQILAVAAGVPQLAAAALFSVGLGGMCYVTTPSQFDRVNGALLATYALTFAVGVTGAGIGRGADPCLSNHVLPQLPPFVSPWRVHTLPTSPALRATCAHVFIS